MSQNTPFGIEDPDVIEQNFKISKTILEMPKGVRERFMAMKILFNECNDLDEEEQIEIHELELMYEQLYEEIDDMRSMVISGQVGQDEVNSPSFFSDYITQFENKLKNFQADNNFESIVPKPCDVKDTLELMASKQKTPYLLFQGVANFWLRCMLNHPNIGTKINERDRQILKYCTNIKIELHRDYGFGFDLTFFFEGCEQYFPEKELVRSFTMSRPNVIEKTTATKINWLEGMDPSRKKVKKKRKGKKIQVDVIVPSFFSFFDQIRMPTDEELVKGNLTVKIPGAEKEINLDEDKGLFDEEDTSRLGEEKGKKLLGQGMQANPEEVAEEDVGERLDQDFQLAQDFKDELVPLAFEYYLNVVEHGSDTESEGSDDDDKSSKNEENKTDECKQQ